MSADGWHGDEPLIELERQNRQARIDNERMMVSKERFYDMPASMRSNAFEISDIALRMIQQLAEIANYPTISDLQQVDRIIILGSQLRAEVERMGK